MSVRWPDVDHPRSPQGYQWPPNLLIAQGPAAWPRGRRPASEAEEILSDAVAWWDVDRSGFRDGDRWLRNIGQAGGVLDLRLGSSLLANSNDPKWLGVEQSGYVYLPGVADNYLSVPHAGTTWPTGDIDLRVQVGMDSWTPSTAPALISKRDGSGYSYLFFVVSDGTLALQWTSNGSTVIGAISTASTGLAAGSVAWVRVTVDVDNGASGNDVKFFTSADGVSWTQLGNTITQSGTTSVFASTAPVWVGYRFIGNPLSGSVYRAQVLNGIDGSTVLDVDCDALTSGSATSFTATTGQTVSISRASSGRKSVAMPARRNGGRACFLLGSDDFLEVVDSQQHGLLNFYGSDSFTALAVVRQWATPGNAGLVTKGGTSGNSRWAMYIPNATYGTGLVAVDQNGGSINPNGGSAVTAAGTQTLFTSILNRAARTSVVYANTGASSTASTAALSNTYNQNLVQVGRWGTNYLNGEFRMGAIFRRALTTREITVLANSGIWGT